MLGEFSEIIYGSNEDGSVVIGNTNVFDGTTFRVLSALSVMAVSPDMVAPLPITTSTMTLSASQEKLYLYEVTSSRISVCPLTDL